MPVIPDQNDRYSSNQKNNGHFGFVRPKWPSFEIDNYRLFWLKNRLKESVDPNRPSTFTNEIKLTCRCISPSFSTTFVLVNLIFFEYLLAFLKNKIIIFIKKCQFNKNPKISMKCSIFRTHGKSENWICIFIWLKSLETKTWKCEFLTFYKLTEWNGTESNTFFTSNRKTTENNFVFSIFEKKNRKLKSFEWK